MNLAFLLHFYQPPTQTESTFRTITQECYVPLIKIIKDKPNYKFTLNIPLSLVEQLERYGYNDILSTITDLIKSENIELSGSAAYHPLLTKIDKSFVTKQIILNEYGLGYYFGQRQGFEGEMSIMIKDVRGFFPPEMAINATVLEVVNDLGYDWVLVDDHAVGNEGKNIFEVPLVYSFGDTQTKLVLRDSTLSNMLSFKRDGESQDVTFYLDYLKEKNADTVVVALDAETFGHHNKEGIYFFESLLSRMQASNINAITVSESIRGVMPAKLETLYESTWSSLENDIYPFWDDKTNKIQKLLWKIQDIIVKEFSKQKPPAIEDGYENIAVWKESELNKLPKQVDQDFLKLELMVYKAMHSDQFWWASGKTVYDQTLYSPDMVINALGLYKAICSYDSMKDVVQKVSESSEQVTKLLSKS